jgi:hypothetical protein
MKKIGTVAALVLAVLLVGAYPILAEGGTPAGTSTHPPTNLKKVGDHWTPWSPPQAGPDAYIIQRGDTLWDLAGKWLGDPHLWPQVWDLNRYVEDSHWIYPGDPLGVPGKPTVVPPGGPPAAPPAEETGATAEAPQEQPAAPARPLPPPPPAPLLPVADASDVYCSGMIEPQHEISPLSLIGRETEREHVAQGDVVYLNHGRDQGIVPGAAYQLQRVAGPVAHPATMGGLGTMLTRLGKVRILAVQESTSTAVIEQSCAPIQQGDEAVPWREIPIPRMASMPKFDRWDATPSGGPDGYVVAMKDGLPAVGSGHVMFTDLGTAKGLQPGSVLRVFRDQQGLPRMNLGQAVVLETAQDTSTVKVTLAVKEMAVGDRVELDR